MVRFALFFSLFFAASDLVAQQNATVPPNLDSIRWLTGHWGSEQNGRVTEEIWMAPKGGMMLGINRSVKQRGKASFEFLRLQVVNDEIIYFASPGGTKPTPFSLKSSGENRAVFENEKNEFPQRIVYRLENDQLIARIEGTIDGNNRSMEWKWSKQKPEKK